MTTLSLIAAVARNGTIGKDGALLWHLPQDLQFFKQTTLGSPIIMGRKTYESIGRPLPARHNIVVTRNPQWQVQGVDAVASPDAALKLLADAPKAFVIGGAQLYSAFLPLADELLITEVDAIFEGDTFFPAWDRSAFAEVSRHEQFASPPQGPNQKGMAYAFVTYKRI